MNFSNICRTCLSSDSLNPIFPNICDYNRYSSALYLTTGLKVEINDGLPQNMCAQCIGCMNSFLRFRKQCRASEKKLLEWKCRADVSGYGKSQSMPKEYQEMPKSNHDIQVKIEVLSDDNDEKPFTDIADELNVCAFGNSNEGNITEQNCNEVTPNVKGSEEVVPCRLCPQELSRTSVDSHMARRHPGDKSEEVKCEFCEDNIIKSDLDRHQFMIHGKNGLEFEGPSELFKSNEESSKVENEFDVKTEFIDIDVHLNKDDEKSLIDIVDDQDRSSLGIMASTVVNEEKFFKPVRDGMGKRERVTCLLCQQELSVRSVDGHMARRHPGLDERKAKCELCEAYVLRAKMNRHRLMMHGKRGFGCGYCKSEFDSKELLLEHVPTCTAKKKKRKAAESSRELLECDVCHKSMQKGSLRLHKEVKHAGLKPVCQHCGRRFGSKFRLSEHYRAKHGYEKFKCPRCEFQSASATGMSNHERWHLGEKPYVCESCGAEFHAAYLLAQHKQSHRTEKLLKCELCPASFKANNSLHMHRRTCHSTSLYRCTMCDRTYSNRHYVVKHLRQVHQYRGAVPRLQQLPVQSDGA